MEGKTNISEIFGENVFNDTVMQERLPKKIYKELKQTIREGKELDLAVADVVAHEMCIRDSHTELELIAGESKGRSPVTILSLIHIWSKRGARR